LKLQGSVNYILHPITWGGKVTRLKVEWNLMIRKSYEYFK